MIRRIRLNDEVRPDKGVAPEDLGQVRWTLSHLGLFDPGLDLPKSETQMGAGLKRALRVFQSGQGLREDAVLRPRGPTEERLNLLLEQERGLTAPAPGTDQKQGRTNLAGRVGLGLENHPDDVAVVAAGLRRTGHIKPGARNPPGTGMVFDGLKSFQRATGLERDGIIGPGRADRATLGQEPRG